MAATGAKLVKASLPNIYISYRRSDADITKVLHAQLQRRFLYQLVLDQSAIEPGADFAETLQRSLAAASVVLVLIGRDWTPSASDWLSYEVTIALQLGKPILPVLVDGARMPSAADLPGNLLGLLRFNAIELSTTGWDHDVRRIASALESLLDPVAAASPSDSGDKRVSP